VPLLLAALAVVTAGAVLPATPFGRMMGFQPLPGPFFLALVLMVIAYLLLIELGKHWFYRSYRATAAAPARPAAPARRRRVHRRAARFTTHHRLPRSPGAWEAAGGPR
jgi:Mg2+-importing ATPase